MSLRLYQLTGFDFVIEDRTKLCLDIQHTVELLKKLKAYQAPRTVQNYIINIETTKNAVHPRR